MKAEIIKFRVEHKQKPLSGFDISQFQKYKPGLLKRKLIGTLEKGNFYGYDYGNMSIRMSDNKGGLNVLITGTQTSGKVDVVLEDFAVILEYNPDLFLIRSYGMAVPSSEVPLHWSAYMANGNIGAIIHAHIPEYDQLYKLVLGFFNKKFLPLARAAGGTKEIGLEVSDIIRKSGYKDIIGMPNHNGGFGLLSLGKDMEEAYSKLIELHGELAN